MGAPGRGCQSTRHQDSSELKRHCSSLLKIPAGVSRSRGCYRLITKDRGVWLCMVAHVCRAHHTKHTTMPPGSVSNWNLVRITEYDWNQQENTSMTNKKFQLNMKHILVLGCFFNRSDPWDYSLFISFDPFHLSNIYYTKLPLCLNGGVLKDWRDLQPLFLKCYIPFISSLHVSRACEIAFVRQAPASCCCSISHSHSFMHSYGITQYPASRACSVQGITHTHTLKIKIADSTQT